jgi:hypothetical protein
LTDLATIEPMSKHIDTEFLLKPPPRTEDGPRASPKNDEERCHGAEEDAQPKEPTGHGLHRATSSSLNHRLHVAHVAPAVASPNPQAGDASITNDGRHGAEAAQG